MSNLDVILEAIRYIDHLQDQLVTQISSASPSSSPAAAAAITAATKLSFNFVGKENTDGDLLRELQRRRQRQQRRRRSE